MFRKLFSGDGLVDVGAADYPVHAAQDLYDSELERSRVRLLFAVTSVDTT